LGLKIITILVLASAAAVVLGAMIRSRKGGRALFLTALQGLAALCAVNLTGMLSGVTIALNWYSLGAGLLFGAPGIIGILLLNFLFRT